jgi:putative copper export protein
MLAYLSPRHRHQTTTARLRRTTAALAAAALGLLAWAAAPAAFAQVLPPDDNYGPAHGTTVPVITAGGTPGWQITVIAVAAALIAAVAAVLLDRARTSRRSAASAG